MTLKKKYYKVIIIVLFILSIYLIIKILSSNSDESKEFRNDRIKTELIINANKFNDLFELYEEIKLKGKMLGSIIRIKKMPNGHFGIIDDSSKRLNIFNPEGQFIKTVGGLGEGPGEYLNAADFTFDNEGNVYILDPGLYKLLSFDGQGNFKWSRRINEYADNIFLFDNKLYLYNTVNMIDRPSGACYDLNSGEKLFDFAEPTEYLKLLIKNKYISLLVNSKSAEIYNNKIYLINPYQYAIRVFNLSGSEDKFIYGASKYFIPYDSSKEFDLFSVNPQNFFKSVLNSVSIWSDIIIISFLNNEMKSIFIDFYSLTGHKLNKNSIEIPENLFNPKSFFPFYIDSENLFYYYLQPQPDSLLLLPNPIVMKYKFLAIRD